MGELMQERPLAIDLFTGLHGWSEGLVAKGFRVVGFDLEDMCAKFGQPRPDHVQLVIQDICTLHGSQFKDAALIVASPPCQEYSYMAMPWSLAKAKAKEIRSDATGQKLVALNLLFNECFRIQREACFAAGRHIPMIVENVRGAQSWVGRARYNFGSFYLWGDVPALMPVTASRSVMKAGVSHQKDGRTNFHHTKDYGQKVPGFRFDGSGASFQTASVEHTGVKAPGMNWSDRTRRGQDFTRIAGKHATAGKKQGGDWFAEARAGGSGGTSASFGSKSPQRKMASALIAKIPLPLSLYIASVYYPQK